MSEARRLEDFLALDVPVLVERDADSASYFVSVTIWPGCVSDGDSLDGAFSNLQEAKRSWLEAQIKRDRPIPLPEPEQEYSGKFNVRLPRTLHRQLVEQAEKEGVSLNTLVVTCLSREMGRREQSTPELQRNSAK